MLAGVEGKGDKAKDRTEDIMVERQVLMKINGLRNDGTWSGPVEHKELRTKMKGRGAELYSKN